MYIINDFYMQNVIFIFNKQIKNIKIIKYKSMKKI